MSTETPPPPPPPPPPAPPPEPPKFAGKFADEAGLAKGITEIFNKLGAPLPADKPVLGENGVYSTVDAAVIGYKTAETMLGLKSAAKPPAAPTDPPRIADTPAPKPDADVTDIIKSAGLDPAALEETFTKNGKLDDAHYEALKKISPAYTKPVVDRIAKGLAADRVIAQEAVGKAVSAAAEAVGGRDQMDALLKDAPNFLDKDEIGDFNERLADPRKVGLAVKQLAALRTARVGTVTTRATGQAPIGSGNTPKDSAEFARWVEQARMGDDAAAARIRAVPMDWINAQKPR